ncbi:hypothetical protein JTB14_004617 [Gonioctena quinquepunctata]|nr:hypothetical protein JTB14_004617 [Gonioctena quinquepunctata]
MSGAEISNKLLQAEIQKGNEESKSALQGTKERYITVESIIILMKNILHIELVESDFNNIYPLGNTNKSPVKVEFTSYLKKIEVLRSTKNLKGTSISTAHDLSEQQRIEFKNLRKHLHAARQDKNNTCYIRNNRLHVNNRIFIPSDSENLEEGF